MAAVATTLTLFSFFTVVLCTAPQKKSGGSNLNKKQLSELDLSSLDASQIGDNLGDSLDFICDTFCPKPDPCDEPAVKHEDILEELGNLNELVALQSTAIETLKTEVESRSTGSDVIPLEYRPTYPVFLLESDYGRYWFTLDEARRACQDKGAQLATYKQVLAAWERGIDMCSCGWIEEGYAIYPIWYGRDGCTNKIGPGIRYNCTWQSTWNAWCFSKDIANKVA